MSPHEYSRRQFDLRDPEASKSDSPRNVLVNLNDHLGPSAEAKCLSINALRPEQLAVGANDPYVRLYDRRMLRCRPAAFPTRATSDSRMRYGEDCELVKLGKLKRTQKFFCSYNYYLLTCRLFLTSHQILILE